MKIRTITGMQMHKLTSPKLMFSKPCWTLTTELQKSQILRIKTHKHFEIKNTKMNG